MLSATSGCRHSLSRMTAVSPASVLPRRFSRTGHTCAVRLETWDLTDVPSLRQGGPPGKEEARTEGLENDEIQVLIVGSLSGFDLVRPDRVPGALRDARRSDLARRPGQARPPASVEFLIQYSPIAIRSSSSTVSLVNLCTCCCSFSMSFSLPRTPRRGPAAAHGALRLRPARAGRGLAF